MKVIKKKAIALFKDKLFDNFLINRGIIEFSCHIKISIGYIPNKGDKSALQIIFSICKSTHHSWIILNCC